MAGKRTQKINEGVDPTKLYALTTAIGMVKERAVAKFDETIEVSMNLGVDPRHADQMVRGVVNLPNGTGRTVRVAVFARGVKADEAKAAGADIVGAEELVEIVQSGKIEFDRCIATPDMMPLVGRLGKVLGPRGMMPNPKVGTVTMDVAGAVKASKGGKGWYRSRRHRQGILRCQGSGRKHPCLRRCGHQGEAGWRQGQLRQARCDLLDHGSGCQDRGWLGHRSGYGGLSFIGLRSDYKNSGLARGRDIPEKSGILSEIAGGFPLITLPA